jgi:hypothetical protein
VRETTGWLVFIAVLKSRAAVTAAGLAVTPGCLKDEIAVFVYVCAAVASATASRVPGISAATALLSAYVEGLEGNRAFLASSGAAAGAACSATCTSV